MVIQISVFYLMLLLKGQCHATYLLNLFVQYKPDDKMITMFKVVIFFFSRKHNLYEIILLPSMCWAILINLAE